MINKVSLSLSLSRLFSLIDSQFRCKTPPIRLKYSSSQWMPSVLLADHAASRLLRFGSPNFPLGSSPPTNIPVYPSQILSTSTLQPLPTDLKYRLDDNSNKGKLTGASPLIQGRLIAISPPLLPFFFPSFYCGDIYTNQVRGDAFRWIGLQLEATEVFGDFDTRHHW